MRRHRRRLRLLLGDSAAADACGTILGTPQFMAPEQARGEVVDPRADIYALGAMLIRDAGAAPFVGETTAEVLERLTTTAPPPLASLQPRAPRELVAIVQKAMARAASDRYAHVDELVADLQRGDVSGVVTSKLVRPRWHSSRAGGRRTPRSSARTSRRGSAVRGATAAK